MRVWIQTCHFGFMPFLYRSSDRHFFFADVVIETIVQIFINVNDILIFMLLHC